MPSRKQVLKLIASLPVAGSIAGSEWLRKTSTGESGRKDYPRDYFSELGLRPLPGEQ
ncbi:MAG: hypothetical protein WD317_10300 [Balneolaceae bacterium]